MPYIRKSRRTELALGCASLTVGELNYRITKQILGFLGARPLENYDTYNEVVGVLECVKLEMYRRRIARYEDKKKKENGDVY